MNIYEAMKLSGKVITPAMIWEITPEMAAEMLATSIGNRKLRQKVVDSYARDMSEDKWEVTADPIMFDEDGHLMNAHHRLTACVKSGCSFKALVAVDFPRSKFIDGGVARTQQDRNFFAGMSDIFCNKKIIALARYALSVQFNGTTTISLAQINEFVIVNYDAIEAIYSALTKGKIKACAGLAMLSASITGVDKDEIIRFATILETGIPSDAVKDRPALLYRNYLSETKIKTAYSLGEVKRAQNALYHYVVGDGAKKVYEPKNLMWALPRNDGAVQRIGDDE